MSNPLAQRRRGPHKSARALVVMACVAGLASAKPVEHGQDGPPIFSPDATRTLRSFRAVGDGRSDDTAALQRAFDESGDFCLEGQGATYRVIGTLRVAKDFCLRNAVLKQGMVPLDTTPFFGGRCGTTQNADAVLDCGDAMVAKGSLAKLNATISVRTLLIRPGDESARLRVFLDHVTIDRGQFPDGGSRTDSAGIWLDHAERVDFRNVEVTGDGKGFGLLISHSSNITLDDLFVHDLTWSPYRGDALLKESEVATKGWNSVAIREFRNWGAQAGRPKFYGVRIQEQLTCVGLFNVAHVRIRRARIHRCLARFDTRDLPWQTDGLGIGGASRDILIANSSVQSTWEGIDVVGAGAGIDDLVINDFTVLDSFSFGVKLGYRLQNSRLSRLTVTNSGLAGIVIYGAVRKLVVTDATVRNVGAINAGSKPFVPWPAATRAGLRIDEAPHGVPSDVLVRNLIVTQRGPGPAFQFAMLNNGGTNVRIDGFRAKGFTVEPRRNNPPTL